MSDALPRMRADEAFVATGLCATIAEANRLIGGGGAYIGSQQVVDGSYMAHHGDMLKAGLIGTPVKLVLTDPTNPAPPAEELRESTRRTDFIAFMLGAGPFEGQWFSDPHPGRRGNFWWRTDFRELLLGHIAALEAEKSVLTVENERLREELDIHALAKCVHEARFDGPVTTSWEDEFESGKVYCYRIANAVEMHLMSRAALSSLPAMKGEG